MISKYTQKKMFLINTLYICVILILAYVFFKYGVNIISPFLFAFIIAYILKQPAKFLSAKTKIPIKPVSILLVVLFYSTIGVIFALLGIKAISMISNFISSLPALYENQFAPFLFSIFDSVEKNVYQLDPALVDVLNEGSTQFVNSLDQTITNLSMTVLGYLSSIASSFPAFFIKVILMIITTFFIASDYEMLSAFIFRQFSEKTNTIIKTVRDYIINTLFVVIRSYAIIMSITFVELSIGFTLIGIPNSLLIAFIIALFDILPVLGTGGVMIPWLVIALLQGRFSLALGLGVIYLAVTVIRNIIEPKIVGSQLGLHPIVTLMSMFVGVHILGVIGLFGFPIVLSLLKYLNDKGTIKILK